MIRCFIDGREVDFDPGQGVAISLSVASVAQIQTGRTGYSKALRLPMSALNREILGDAGEVHAPELFNQGEHSARIEADGCTVMQGVPMLLRREENPDTGGGWYYLSILGPGKEWIRIAAARMFRELEIGFSVGLTGTAVLNSWTWERPVRFFPVQHDSFALPSETIQAGVRMITFEDYFPFLHVRSLMEAIAAQGGYTICSEFMDSAFFRSLYMSGRYQEHDPAIPNERMGFRAGRFAAASAAADRFGRVYADPFTSISSVGNLVDTADPTESRDGVTLEGVYNRNGCLKRVGTRLGFFPVESIVAGFEYALSYRSDYYIASRTELGCFNRLLLDDGLERQYKVVNRYEDRRGEFAANRSYRLVVFNHVEGNSYRLNYDRIASSGAATSVSLKTFAERSVAITSPSGESVANPQLWIRNPDASYSLYTQDWALYDGYVTETGQVDIAVTARSAARTVAPSGGAYFDDIYFGGAREGMQMTLTNAVTLRPVFTSHPGEGTTVTFAQVAAHEIRQIDLVSALRQMFNLYFYTDTLAGKIYIEPREEFYTDTLVDWSEKIDLSQPVTVEELGAEMARTFTLRYQFGDGTVARYDSAHKEVVGRWSAGIANRFATEEEHTYFNPLFTPSLNTEGSYPDAPQLSLLQVGDRDSNGGNPEKENLNFPAKIVSYAGVQTLPEGQYWGWPAYSRAYPLIAFHDARSRTPSLCFEERGGQRGLHRYYDKTVEGYNAGRRITLYLDLRPEEVEAFILPNELKRDFRALFKLRVRGEEVFCRLEEIVDYNPARGGSTRCVFLKNV